MKTCSICGKPLEEEKEYAVLLIGRYGTVYQICEQCEENTDALASRQNDEARKSAADYMYKKVFEEKNGRCSPEVVDYLNELIKGDESTISEAIDAVNSEGAAEEDEEGAGGEDSEKSKAVPSDGTDTNDKDPGQDALDAIASDSDEDDGGYISEEPKKTSLAVRIIFLLIFLLIGAGVLAYGIMQSAVSTIVIGVVVLLIGVASVFIKD